MELNVRLATNRDKAQMLRLYSNFMGQFVGSASRTSKSFTHMLRKKDNINYVAVDPQKEILGYIHASVDKRNHSAEISEIIVDPKFDFVQVASLLVDKVNKVFADRKVSLIFAGSLRNPAYEKIFPKLGFFESESTGVFMYAALDVGKLMNELWPVFASRLKRAENFEGLVQLECDGQSVFFKKASASVEPVVWTNLPVDFRVKFNAATLTRIIFGVTDVSECRDTGLVQIESKLDEKEADVLLSTLFPRKQFLIMDHW
jgi:hypothetical protein